MVVRVLGGRFGPCFAVLLAACAGTGEARGAAGSERRTGVQPGSDAGALGQLDANGLDAPDMLDGVGRDGSVPGSDGGGGFAQERFRYGLGCSKLPAADPVTALTLLPDPFAGTNASMWTTGQTVAIDGDTLVVGAPRSGAAVSAGAAFVYGRNAFGQWEYQARLDPPAGGSDGGFGQGVALSGDTLLVSAPNEFFEAPIGPNAGRVYVYRRGASGFGFESTLQAKAPADGDQFGYEMALSGDTLAIYTYQQGADGVELFERSGGSWTRKAVLEPIVPVDGYGYGSTLALDGDTLAVGVTPGVGVPGQAVHMYLRRAGVWEPDVVLMPDQPGQFFAAQVALQGDTLLVSDTYYDDANTDSALATGAVYVYERDCAGVWAQGAFLRASPEAIGYGFGRTLALDDGRMIVGASQDCSLASGIDGAFGLATDADAYSGAIYIFGRTDEGHGLLHYVKSNTVQLREKYFGDSLAASGGEIVIGARGERAAYVLR